MLHNHGAIAALEQLLGVLDPRGVIVINDYGSAEGAEHGDHFEHQRYGGGSFVGVNFDQLKRYFTNRPHPPDGASHTPLRWAEPEKDSSHIYSRLLGHDLHPDVVATFHRCFDGTAATERDRPAQAARVLASQGRYEGAATAYRARWNTRLGTGWSSSRPPTSSPSDFRTPAPVPNWLAQDWN